MDYRGCSPEPSNAIHMDIKTSETMDESSFDQTSADFPMAGRGLSVKHYKMKALKQEVKAIKDASAPAEDVQWPQPMDAQAIAEGEPSPPELTIYSIPKMPPCQRQGPPNAIR